MSDIVFIGDEMSATAYRLAGIAVIVAGPEETVTVLDEEISPDTNLVLLASPHAASMSMEELSRRMREASPPLVVVEDAAGKTALPDFVTMLRRRLGVAT